MASAPLPSRSFPRPLAAALALGLLAAGGYLAAELFLLSGGLGFPLDDSWIHLQFARNLAAGQGLSFNPGEAVTGSTAPLWTAILALLFHLPGSVVVWTQLAGIALHLAGIWATFRLARELDLSEGLAGLAAAFVALTGWLAWSAVSGMEVPLFVVLSLGGLILHLRERRDSARPPLSFLVLGLAILARPEGMLLVVLAAADRLIVWERHGADIGGSADGEGTEPGLRLRRPALRPVALGLGLVVLAVAGTFFYYWKTGGSLLPTTYAAKGAGGVRHFLPSLQYVYVILGIFFKPQPYLTLLAGAGAVALLARLGTPRDRGLLPALWVVALPLAYSTLSPEGSHLIAGNFGRYYFPLFPPLVVLGVLGLERAARALPARLSAGAVALPLRALAVLLLAWPTFSNLVEGAGRYAQNVANVEDSDVKVARWLQGKLDPRAVLAVNDIGAIKFLLPNRIVDVAGIASPDFRRDTDAALAAGLRWDQALYAALEKRRPDYLVVFPSWVPSLASDPRFRPVYGFTIPNNITMGGDQIGVYATPWTRYPLAAP
jgi:4-amino-4-deoxy-L-arabinose transferase-like glycosyltransferase